MTWSRIACSITSDPKLDALANGLDIPTAHAVGLFVSLLAHVAQHAEQGDVAGVTDLTLARWAGWTGDLLALREALAQAGLLVDGIVVAWDKHNGDPLRKARERQARWREKHKQRAASPAERQAKRRSRDVTRDATLTSRNVADVDMSHDARVTSRDSARDICVTPSVTAEPQATLALALTATDARNVTPTSYDTKRDDTKRVVSTSPRAASNGSARRSRNVTPDDADASDATLVRLPKARCDALFELWGEHIGAVAYPRFRKALLVLYARSTMPWDDRDASGALQVYAEHRTPKGLRKPEDFVAQFKQWLAYFRRGPHAWGVETP